MRRKKMRKILLGTTAVVGAALLSTGAFAQGAPAPSPSLAGAGGLTVRLGGYFEFSGAMIQDNNDYASTRNTRGSISTARARSRYDFRNDLELHVFIDGRAANGMTYGAVFEFQMDNAVTGAADGSTVSMDEAYGFIAFPNLGRIYFGAEDSAASLLQVRHPAAGVLTADGVWDEFIVQQGLYGSSPYLTSGINDGNDATKIGYLSPQFFGFDFGISYAPNSFEGERTEVPGGGNSQRDRTGLENELSVGLRYRGTFGPVGVQAGFGAMRADAARQNANGTPIANRQQTVTAYTVGARVDAYGFAFGGEYTWGQYNGPSVGRTALNRGLDDSWHYVLGATYTLGPVVFGALFGQAQQDNGTNAGGVPLPDRKHTIWGLGVVYTMAPGLQLFAGYNHIEDKNIPTGAPVVGGAGTTLATFENGSRTRKIDIALAGVRLAF
jgi:predicted porin